MRLLITAGGTKEDIDPVRGITNYATGRLGRLIAERFISSGDTVTYICGENSERPEYNPNLTNLKTPNLQIIEIKNTAGLLEQLEAALYGRPYDAVIHSMAVSDYAPCNISNEKISSDSPYLVVVLKRQPKVIDRIKKIQPDTILVGFKLLSEAKENELVQASHNQMARSRSDYVLANNLEDICGDRHRAILIDRNGIVARGETKEEIAELIYREVATAYDYTTRNYGQYCSV